MALVKEDGTGVASANSYSTTAEAQTYYDDMGYSDTPTDAKMIRASRTLDAMFLSVLKGTKKDADQTMQWPRDAMTDEDGNEVGDQEVPARYVQAAQELARIIDTSSSYDTGKWIQEVWAGSVRVKFKVAMNVRATINYVWELVRPYLRPGGVSR